MNAIQEAWNRMVATCREEGLPFMLHLWDGEHDTGVAGSPDSKTVMLCDIPDSADASLAGKVIIQLDAKMLLRILPSLVRETHRALGLIPDRETEDHPVSP